MTEAVQATVIDVISDATRPSPYVRCQRHVAGDEHRSDSPRDERRGESAAGRILASVEVRGSGVDVLLSFRVAAGHMPMTVRGQLVDAVFELPDVHDCRRLTATVPIGDAQLLTGLRAHCHASVTHPAGATCLFDAQVGDS